MVAVVDQDVTDVHVSMMAIARATFVDRLYAQATTDDAYYSFLRQGLILCRTIFSAFPSVYSLSMTYYINKIHYITIALEMCFYH